MHDYKAMSVFVTVVKQGSMQAAATHLKMTPSAVTQTIQKLEQGLKIQLLNRTTRRLYLTEAGEAFYEHAVLMEQSAEKAVKSIEQLRSSPSGQLNIACPTGFTDSLFIQAFKSVLDTYSEFKLNLMFDDKLTNLPDQRVDLAIRGGEGVLNDDMIARHIIDFEWNIVASPDYFCDKTMPETLDDLQNLDWVSFSNPKFTQLHLQKGKQKYTMRPAYRVHCNSLYASRQMTLNALGVSIQPDADVTKLLKKGELIRLFSEWKMPVIPIYLITLQRVQSEKVRIAYELIMEYFKKQQSKY